MKKLINKVLEATLILLSILFLGMLIPTVIGMFIYFTTRITFVECFTHNYAFWSFSIVGCMISGSYIYYLVVEDDILNQ